MSTNPRITHQTLKVLSLFMASPTKELSGADITKSVSIMSGTLYPILMRLEDAGWLESNWEEENPSNLGRPRRRYYRITAIGQNQTRKLIDDLNPIGFVPSWQH